MRKMGSNPHEMLRRQRLVNSKPLKEVYPQVSDLTINMSFEDPEGFSQPEPRTKIFTQDCLFFFEIECPLDECINGGFDLASAVSELVTRSGSEASGERTCQGWQDSERRNQHRCLSKLTFTVSVTYRDDLPA